MSFDVEFPAPAPRERAASPAPSVVIEDLGIDDYPLWTPSEPDTTDPAPALIPVPARVPDGFPLTHNNATDTSDSTLSSLSDLTSDSSVPARPRTEPLPKTQIQSQTIVTRPFPVSPTYADIENLLLAHIEEIHNTQADAQQADEQISAIKHKLLVLARVRSEDCSTDDEDNESGVLAPSIASSSDGYESEIEWETQSEAVLETSSAASSSVGPGFSWDSQSEASSATTSDVSEERTLAMRALFHSISLANFSDDSESEWESQSEDLLDTDTDSISIGSKCEHDCTDSTDSDEADTSDELETPPQFSPGTYTWSFTTLYTLAHHFGLRAAILQSSDFDRREHTASGPESDEVAIEDDHGCGPFCSCMYDGAF